MKKTRGKNIHLDTVNALHHIELLDFVKASYMLINSYDLVSSQDLRRAAQRIAQESEKLDVQRRIDIYTALVVNISALFINKHQKSLGTIALSKAARNAKKREIPQVNIPSENSVLRRARVEGLMSKIIPGEVNRIVFSDIEKISSELVRGGSDLPKISIKLLPPGIENRDFLCLFKGLVSCVESLAG